MTKNTPSEALVEAMARAIYNDGRGPRVTPFDQLAKGAKHYWYDRAQAAAAVVQAGLDDRASTTSPVDDSETGNTSGKPDIEAAVKSDTAPVSDKLVEALREVLPTHICEVGKLWAANLRTALAARGGRVVFDGREGQ